jgi:hypothetical protein
MIILYPAVAPNPRYGLVHVTRDVKIGLALSLFPRTIPSTRHLFLSVTHVSQERSSYHTQFPLVFDYVYWRRDRLYVRIGLALSLSTLTVLSPLAPFLRLDISFFLSRVPQERYHTQFPLVFNYVHWRRD